MDKLNETENVSLRWLGQMGFLIEAARIKRVRYAFTARERKVPAHDRTP